ncbi:MAG: ABC transporter ATP-binding protein [Clostridiales bacterium]|nr:ABC transporter ATP-binding protein [Clostridiales bacterium]
MLKVNDLNVYYGAIHALHGVSFEVNQGEIVTLIGANGAGKSTTLKTISGQMRSKTGSIEFMGEKLDGLAPYKIARIGIAQVPEGRKIFQQLTVEENLDIGGYTQEPDQVKAAVEDVFKRFPRLKERRKQVAGTLSGGEQQMLAIGRALMGRPKLMMLDEPSMGLAPKLVDQIFDIIRELNRSGVTILLVEQNALMALRLASRGYVLETGRVAIADASENLLKNDRVKRAYLGG